VVLVEKAEEEVVEVLCVRGRDEEGGEGGQWCSVKEEGESTSLNKVCIKRSHASPTSFIPVEANAFVRPFSLVLKSSTIDLSFLFLCLDMHNSRVFPGSERFPQERQWSRVAFSCWGEERVAEQ